MALIVICVWSMASEINGTLKFAGTCIQAGHRVCYVGVPDCGPIIHDNGFDFVPVLERWLPAGSIDDRRFYNLVRVPEWRRVVRAIRRKHRFEKVLRELLQNRDNDVEKAFRKLKPDLVIIGTHTPHTHIFGFLAACLRIRCAYLTQQMFYIPAPKSLEPQDQAPYRYLVNKIYERTIFRYVNINYPKFFRAFLDATGLPPHLLNYRSGRYPLRAPILYPWPKPFELPGIVHANVLLIEAGVRPDRTEDTTILNLLPKGTALIYCSFGTLLPLGLERTRDLIEKVIECMREMPDIQMVLAIGPYFEVSEFRGVPANTRLCGWTPQMEILKRSNVVITHGGSATVPECLLLGIPMIVIPLGYESAEYARRVAHHQLGFDIDYRNLTVAQLTVSIRTLLTDPHYKQAATLMKLSIEHWESHRPSLAALEICLRNTTLLEGVIAIP